MTEHRIILFDGVCNLYNNAVNFVIRRNTKSVLKSAFLQSDIAFKILSEYNLPGADLSSFVLIEKCKIYARLTAALQVCRSLKGLWPLLYGLIIVRKFIRNGIYNWIAKNRYQWFGIKNECMSPTPKIKSRFLIELYDK